MTLTSQVHKSIDQLLALVASANQAVMDVYATDDFGTSEKSDHSPVTAADLAAHTILSEGLVALFPDIPVISEEGDDTYNYQTVQSDRFWLVDPLDGTSEFIKKTGEFTVCVGLVEHGRAVYGIVGAPARGAIYYGGPETGSFCKTDNQPARSLHAATTPTDIIMGSASHREEPTDTYIAAHYPQATTQPLGSQLKFLAIADGHADAYPRLGSSMKLWDVASGHAIIDGAGGSITRPDGTLIDYREPSLLIGDFVARAT